MGELAPLSLNTPPLESPAPPARVVDDALVSELVTAHYRFIWRLLGRLGVSSADVDDATQQVFLVLARRKNLLLEQGRERAFLFGVALKVSRSHRRTLSRRHEISVGVSPDVEAREPSTEALTDQHRARALLDELLKEMPFDLRVVFVLFELEDAQTTEIMELLDLPQGTVASRLRRAREWFERRVKQVQCEQGFRRQCRE